MIISYFRASPAEYRPFLFFVPLLSRRSPTIELHCYRPMNTLPVYSSAITIIIAKFPSRAGRTNQRFLVTVHRTSFHLQNGRSRRKCEFHGPKEEKVFCMIGILISCIMYTKHQKRNRVGPGARRLLICSFNKVSIGREVWRCFNEARGTYSADISR